MSDSATAGRSRRRAPAFTIAGLLVAMLLAGPAHAGGVAILISSDQPLFVGAARAFHAAYRGPARDVVLADRAPEAVLDEVRGVSPEVVVVIGLRAAEFAHDHLPRTPIVFAMVPFPERHDLVGSWITGVSADVPPELELNALHQVAPDAKRVGVLVGPGSGDWLRAARSAATRLGIELVVANAGSVDQIGPQIRDLAERADALWMPADPVTATPESFRLALAQTLARRHPLFAFAPALVRAGALAAATPDLDWVGARVAEAVRRIQSGERAGDVPVSPVRRVRLVANAATARAIGLELPAGVLRNAEVVQ